MNYTTAVITCWVALCLAYLFRKRPPPAREVSRARRWQWGLLVQSLGVLLVWVFRPHPVPTALSVAAVVLAAVSVGFMVAAQQALGRQFAYEPRLVEDHQLITSGPYRLVRNPIYTGLYGITLATALVRGQWLVLPLATVIFAAGTAMRVRIEARLLRDAFGPQFDEYARRVPAVIPGLRF